MLRDSIPPLSTRASAVCSTSSRLRGTRRRSRFPARFLDGVSAIRRSTPLRAVVVNLAPFRSGTPKSRALTSDTLHRTVARSEPYSVKAGDAIDEGTRTGPLRLGGGHGVARDPEARDR